MDSSELFVEIETNIITHQAAVYIMYYTYLSWISKQEDCWMWNNEQQSLVLQLRGLMSC